jgi:hypothetical protein
MSQEPVIRLDRSKAYSECHGERTPDDPHHGVHYWQGGRLGEHIVLLPFDAQGELVPDDGRTEDYQGAGFDPQGKAAVVKYKPLYDDKMRRYLAAKVKRMKEAVAPLTAPADEITEDLAAPGDVADEVNFVSWLRGEVQYQPHILRKAAKARYSKNYSKIGDIVVDLVLDEQIVGEDHVCDALRIHLPKRAA